MSDRAIILQGWISIIQSQQRSKQERAHKYHTNKIIFKAHGVQGYFPIQFPPEYLALSFEVASLISPHPLQALQEAPEMIGILGSLVEVLLASGEDLGPMPEVTAFASGSYEPGEQEEQVFMTHYSSSLTDSLADALGGFQTKRKSVDFNI